MPVWGTVLTVPDTHPTIQAAIDAASEGDRIDVKAGTYNERLRFKNGIELIGEGADKVFVKGTTAQGILLLAENCTAGRIAGIAFKHTNKESENKKYPDLFIIRDSTLDVAQCLFRNSAGCGIVVEGKSRVAITECTATGCVQAGIIIKGEGCEATLTKNTCNENSWSGIVIHTRAKGAVSENTCARNYSYGIQVTDHAAAVVTKNRCESNACGIIFYEYATGEAIENQCLKNSGTGMSICESATATFRANVVEDSWKGISISARNTRGTVIGNTCRRGNQFCIGVDSGAECTVENNTCEESPCHGIVVANWATRAIVTGNRCNKNVLNGICFMSGCEGEARNNTCDANKAAGICITDEGTTVTADTNTCTNNAGGDTITVPGAPASMQDQIPDEERIAWACQIEDFAYLELLATRLREHKTRSLDCTWALYSFYDAFSKAEPDEEQAPLIEIYERWRAAQPASITPLLVLASYYIDRAWEERGGGYADTVSKDAHKGFTDNLDVAEGYLKQAEQLNVPDPHLYVQYMNVAAGKGYELEKIRALRDKGAAIDKSYYPLHSRFGWVLLPRWYGKPGDFERYMNEAADSTADVLGNQVYALLASYFAGYEPRISLQDNDLIDRQRVYKGYDEVLAQFPTSRRARNRLCHLACLFKDREKAKPLFDSIGTEVDYESAWDSDEDVFRSYKQWAYGLAKYPMANTPEEFTAEVQKKIMRGTPIAGAVMLLLAIAAVVIIVARSTRR